MNNLHTQRGNALFIILLAIALLAALSYAVFQGGRTSSHNLTDEQVRLAALEFIAYGDAVAKGVQKVRLQGCTPGQITFNSHNGLSRRGSGVAYSYNTNTPADKSCDVFAMNGGAITPKLFTNGTIAPSLVNPSYMDSQSFIFTSTRVIGQGSEEADGTDLIMWVGRLKKEVCIKINKLVSVENPGGNPPVDEFNSCQTFFDGTYPNCSDPLGDTVPLKTSFCVQATPGDANGYIFFQVLLSR